MSATRRDRLGEISGPLDKPRNVLFDITAGMESPQFYPLGFCDVEYPADLDRLVKTLVLHVQSTVENSPRTNL